MKYSPLPALVLIILVMTGLAAKAVFTAEIDATMFCGEPDAVANGQLISANTSKHQ